MVDVLQQYLLSLAEATFCIFDKALVESFMRTLLHTLLTLTTEIVEHGENKFDHFDQQHDDECDTEQGGSEDDEIGLETEVGELQADDADITMLVHGEAGDCQDTD